MHPAHDTYTALVERIKSTRAALHLAGDPDTRIALLDELGAATKQLSELILAKEGRLEAPSGGQRGVVRGRGGA